MRAISSLFALLAGCATVDARSAWTRMTHDLPGKWESTSPSGKPLHLEYRLISRGSALVESWSPGSAAETVTIYHPDHAALLATHYCAQGNAARLRASSVTPGRVDFTGTGAANVSRGQGVLDHLSIAFVPGGFDLVETYRQPDGRHETETLHFQRVD